MKLECAIKSILSDYTYIVAFTIIISILFFILTSLLSVLSTMTSTSICILTIILVELCADSVIISLILLFYIDGNKSFNKYILFTMSASIGLFVISVLMTPLYTHNDVIIATDTLIFITIVNVIAMCIISPIIRAYCKCMNK